MSNNGPIHSCPQPLPPRAARGPTWDYHLQINYQIPPLGALLKAYYNYIPEKIPYANWSHTGDG